LVCIAPTKRCCKEPTKEPTLTTPNRALHRQPAAYARGPRTEVVGTKDLQKHTRSHTRTFPLRASRRARLRTMESNRKAQRRHRLRKPRLLRQKRRRVQNGETPYLLVSPQHQTKQQAKHSPSISYSTNPNQTSPLQGRFHHQLRLHHLAPRRRQGLIHRHRRQLPRFQVLPRAGQVHCRYAGRRPVA
jgi:hypothetical protein